MSGRVRVRQPDGRLTTGYRKTQRRNARKPSDAAQSHRLVFQLPTELWTISEGQHGTQIEIGRMRNVTVKGFDRDYVLKLAAEFLQQHGADHRYLRTAGVMQTSRSTDPVQLVMVKGNVIAFYGHVRYLVFMGRK